MARSECPHVSAHEVRAVLQDQSDTGENLPENRLALITVVNPDVLRTLLQKQSKILFNL